LFRSFTEKLENDFASLNRLEAFFRPGDDAAFALIQNPLSIKDETIKHTITHTRVAVN
jgi:hypothetical protein